MSFKLGGEMGYPLVNRILLMTIEIDFLAQANGS